MMGFAALNPSYICYVCDARQLSPLAIPAFT